MKLINNPKFRICPGLLSLMGLGVIGFNSTNASDVLWHYKLAPHPYNRVWAMNGTSYQNQTLMIPLTIQETNANWEIVSTADFNWDPYTDLLWRDKTTGAMAIWLMTNSYNLFPNGDVLPNGDVNYDVVGTGDFDGDGYTDILWRHKTSSLMVVWFMTGSSGTVYANRIGWIASHPEPASWKAEATGDFNNDTHPDILWRHNSTGELSIWYMNGTNMISSAVIQNQTLAADYQIACTGQFWGAGKTDILMRHTATTNNTNLVWVMSDASCLRTAQLVSDGTTTSIPVPDQNWVIAGMGGYRTGLLLSATNLTDTSHTLVWRYGTHGVSPTIEQEKPDKSWTKLQTNYHPPRLTNSTQIVAGQRYEYKFTYPGSLEPEWLSTGTKVTEVLSRGRVLLLIDETLLTTDPTLSADFNRLEEDLVGDGWTVVKDLTGKRHDETPIPPANPFFFGDNPNRITANKNKILSFYNAAPTATNFVFLIGHLAVPYSGSTASDGHDIEGHAGAWPADAFYADIDTPLWKDSIVNSQNNIFPKASNRPGDGKFDNDYLPSNPEIALGRADFFNLPVFPVSETGLIRRYLLKNHNYRHKILAFPDNAQGVTVDNIFDGTQMFENALRLASRGYGMSPARIRHDDYFIAGIGSNLWGCLSGPGNPAAIQGRGLVLHTTASLLTNEPPVAFHMLHGSWFADWNLLPDNIVRGLLATPNFGLAALGVSDKFKTTRWHLEPTGLGDPIGAGVLNGIKTLVAMGQAHRWLALMGDPTLRLQITAPPSNPSWNSSTKTLTWTVSSEDGADPNDVFYVVERSENTADFMAGPWQLVGLTNSNSLVDASAPVTTKRYRIRARKLVTTGSGSFYNLSQSAFKTAP